MNINDKILHAQIKALVNLTRQTSIDSLVEVFVANIKVIFPSKSIVLITSHGPKALNKLAFNSKNLHGAVMKLLQRIGYLDTLSLPAPDEGPKSVVNEEEKSKWVQIPINTDIGVLGFLQIAGIHTEKSIFQAEAHIATFINQISLLSLNERDGLTRLYNRSAFQEKMATVLRPVHHKRKHDQLRQYVLAFIRPDLKSTEEMGVGDVNNVLILVGRMIATTFREYDWSFRYEDETFAVILHECDRELATLALGRLRKRVEGFDFPGLGQITCSIGFTQLDKESGFDNLVNQAMESMQKARTLGGNRLLGYVETH